MEMDESSLLVGGLWGAGIGALLKGDRWSPVPTQHVRVSCAPTVGRGFGLTSVSWVVNSQLVRLPVDWLGTPGAQVALSEDVEGLKIALPHG